SSGFPQLIKGVSDSRVARSKIAVGNGQVVAHGWPSSVHGPSPRMTDDRWAPQPPLSAGYPPGPRRSPLHLVMARAWCRRLRSHQIPKRSRGPNRATPLAPGRFALAMITGRDPLGETRRFEALREALRRA